MKSLDVKEIYSRFRKRPGCSKYLLCVNVKVSDQGGNSIPAKLVYARNRNNKKQWVCFVCTDMRCSPEDILRIYTMRWACLCEPCSYTNFRGRNPVNTDIPASRSSYKTLIESKHPCYFVLVIWS